MQNSLEYTGKRNSVLIMPFQVKGHRSVLLHGIIQRSLNGVSFISHDPVSSNQMTRIYIFLLGVHIIWINQLEITLSTL